MKATPEHKHTFYEIMYVYKGAILNITQNKNIYMSEGDFCIKEPRQFPFPSGP